MRLFGHVAPRTFAASYTSNVCTINVQASFLRQPIRQDHIETLQSMHYWRELDLPKKLPAQAMRELEESPAMDGLRQQLADLSAATCHNPDRRRKSIWNQQLQLRTQALKTFQSQWCQSAYARKIERQTLLSEDAGAEVKPRTHHDSSYYILKVIAECGRFADLFGAGQTMNRQQKRTAVQDLMTLCKQDPSVYYRPQELPADGHCPAAACRASLTYIPLDN